MTTATKKTKKEEQKDPTCLREGCDNPLLPLAIENEDPFCSTSCAREHYGTQEQRKKLT